MRIQRGWGHIYARRQDETCAGGGHLRGGFLLYAQEAAVIRPASFHHLVADGRRCAAFFFKQLEIEYVIYIYIFKIYIYLFITICNRV